MKTKTTRTKYTKRKELMAGVDPALFALVFPERDNQPWGGLQIDFPNRKTLSIIWGIGTYCDARTVEVAVMDSKHFITRKVAQKIFDENIGDDVDGCCDAERVHAYFVAAQEMP